MSDDPTTNLSGVFLANYVLGKRLGSGATGLVFRATQRSLQRPVAIKFLHVAPQASPAVLRRFQQEARVLASLSHPNVLKVYDSGVETLPYLVTELAEGGTLREALHRRGRLVVPDAVRIAREILEALGHLHDNGIVHRDVKPENVFFTSDGQLRLGDFGLVFVETGTSRCTTQGAVLGTPRYMAPELFEGHPFSPACDIYSTGTLLFEILTGRPPFIGGMPDLLSEKLSATAPSPRAFNADIPGALAELTTRLLERNPAARPVAEEILDVLDAVETSLCEQAADGQGTRDGRTVRILRPETAPTKPAVVFGRWARVGPLVRRRAVLGAFLALIGMLTWAIVRSGGEAKPSPEALSDRAAQELTETLGRFDGAGRLSRLADEWRRLFERADVRAGGAGSRAIQSRWIDGRLAELEAAGRAHDLGSHVLRFSQSVRGQRPVRLPDLPLYTALHDLVSLDRLVVRMRRTSREEGGAARCLGGVFKQPLPEPWRESPISRLDQPRALSIRRSGSEGPPVLSIKGAYREHVIVDGWNWTVFSNIRLAVDSPMDLLTGVDPAQLKANLFGKDLLQYEHPRPLVMPPRESMAALELGVLYGPPRSELMYRLMMRSDRGGYRDIALLGRDGDEPGPSDGRNWFTGRTAFLCIDPSIVPAGAVQLAVRLEAVPGASIQYSSRLDCLSIRWLLRSDVAAAR
ncbi:MAG: serine/threonine protein kinase [Candidatus Riflebacteria bacterium]|nr:serine/threonine protein kinase [Candidatus Riflebacteria bacterium]